MSDARGPAVNLAASHFNFHCLPGFLGLGRDWLEVLPRDWVPRVSLYDWFTPQIPEGLEKALEGGLETAAHWVNDLASRSEGPRILMGYSLGGRIGLHALLEKPELWSAAVIISANPGQLADSSLEKILRWKSDQNWARRWLDDFWEQVLQDWNSQPVFAGRNPGLPRVREDFSRVILAKTMESCSLALQKNLCPRLALLDLPILWISGERDVKFRALLQPMSELNPKFSVAVIPEAGHRAPWEQPDHFSELLMSWARKVRRVT